MQIKDIPFSIVDWVLEETTEVAGETGYAEQRLVELGNLRLRQVVYAAGYRADHWCERGHVLYVLSGQMIVELKNGRHFPVHEGSSFQVADGAPAHLVCTANGCTVFIVD